MTGTCPGFHLLSFTYLLQQAYIQSFCRVHLIVAYGDFGHFYNFWSVGFKYHPL